MGGYSTIVFAVDDLNLHTGSAVAGSGDSGVDLAVGSSSNLEVCDVVRWSRLDPHTLPDATTGCVEDMRRVERLFADGYDIVVTICWIVDKDKSVGISACGLLLRRQQLFLQLVVITTTIEMVGHINLEVEVATAIEASVPPIHVHPSFIVDRSEIQQRPFSSPRQWHAERRREPRVKHVLSLYA